MRYGKYFRDLRYAQLATLAFIQPSMLPIYWYLTIFLRPQAEHDSDIGLRNSQRGRNLGEELDKLRRLSRHVSDDQIREVAQPDAVVHAERGGDLAGEKDRLKLLKRRISDEQIRAVTQPDTGDESERSSKRIRGAAAHMARLSPSHSKSDREGFAADIDTAADAASRALAARKVAKESFPQRATHFSAGPGKERNDASDAGTVSAQLVQHAETSPSRTHKGVAETYVSVKGAHAEARQQQSDDAAKDLTHPAVPVTRSAAKGAAVSPSKDTARDSEPATKHDLEWFVKVRHTLSSVGGEQMPLDRYDCSSEI